MFPMKYRQSLTLQTYHGLRRLSSRWKSQRDSDIYANRAITEGMRSRAAYKLEEINKRFDFFLRPVRFTSQLFFNL